MAGTRYPLIAREGWLAVAACVLAAFAALSLGDWLWSLPFWLLAALLLFLFRDPEREIPPTPLGVISPADGVISAIEPVQDPFLKREAIRITLTMSHAGVFTTRSPVEGKIVDMVDAGEGMPHGVWLRTDEGDDIVVVMYRGPLHNAPRCYVRCGERVGQGQRCGYIHLGSQVDLYLPANSRLLVEQGQRVKGGSSVIAMLVHK
ncbi:phosphatidylserine decarboxylase [Thiohalobacter sp. IOR34]|uniref:phosphatidylserine decarboxylase n=1 Tax=Thiohalobacter sp. IOR34 TaxID=3057176 RepID=UPI0025B0EDAF|nr:phosphatidylserine decarboxylase [Thiohalobacter sp. IOR34]WJW76159.1 phosphatidylserine decarboxylase [Thiohalobacter sp. IOR34]